MEIKLNIKLIPSQISDNREQKKVRINQKGIK